MKLESLIWFLFIVAIIFAIAVAFDGLGRDAKLGLSVDERLVDLEARVSALEAQLGQVKSSEKPASAGSEAVIALAKDDLAERLGIYPGDILLVEAEPVEWPDACLGVYEGADACIQVLTPGFKITLRAADRLWIYHAGQERVIYIGPVARQLTA